MESLTQQARKVYRGKAIRAVTNSPFRLEERDQPGQSTPAKQPVADDTTIQSGGLKNKDKELDDRNQAGQSTPAKQPVALGKAIQCGGLKAKDKTIDKNLPLNEIDDDDDEYFQPIYYSSSEGEDYSKEEKPILGQKKLQCLKDEEPTNSEKMAAMDENASKDKVGRSENLDKISVEEKKEIGLEEGSTSKNEVELNESPKEGEPVDKDGTQEKVTEVKTDEILSNKNENEPVSNKEKPSTSRRKRPAPRFAPYHHRYRTAKVPRIVPGNTIKIPGFSPHDLYFPGTAEKLKRCSETLEKINIIKRSPRGQKCILNGILQDYDDKWNLHLTDVFLLWKRYDINHLIGQAKPVRVGKTRFCHTTGVTETYQGHGLWECQRPLFNYSINGEQVIMTKSE